MTTSGSGGSCAPLALTYTGDSAEGADEDVIVIGNGDDLSTSAPRPPAAPPSPPPHTPPSLSSMSPPPGTQDAAMEPDVQQVGSTLTDMSPATAQQPPLCNEFAQMGSPSFLTNAPISMFSPLLPTLTVQRRHGTRAASATADPISPQPAPPSSQDDAREAWVLSPTETGPAGTGPVTLARVRQESPMMLSEVADSPTAAFRGGTPKPTKAASLAALPSLVSPEKPLAPAPKV